MDGESVGVTSAFAMRPVSRKRARMSLALVATMSRSIGRPMRRAAYPANTLPKLPVGTEKATRRSGAPNESAVVK